MTKEDQQFREMIQSSKEYKDERMKRFERQAKESAERSRELRLEANKHREISIKEERIARELEKMAEQYENMAFLYLQSRIDFVNAIIPIIKRKVDKTKRYEFCLGFPEESDIEKYHPGYEGKAKDIIVVYYKELGITQKISKLIISYDTKWHDNVASNKPLNHTLQFGYNAEDFGPTQYNLLCEVPEAKSQLSLEYEF